MKLNSKPIEHNFDNEDVNSKTIFNSFDNEGTNFNNEGANSYTTYISKKIDLLMFKQKIL